jgi:hypothetical protein
MKTSVPPRGTTDGPLLLPKIDDTPREKSMRHILTLSAVLYAAASFGAGAQAAEGKYCLTQALGQAKNCSYQTMAACEKSKASQSDQCGLNAGTTGSSTGSKSGMKQK